MPALVPLTVIALVIGLFLFLNELWATGTGKKIVKSTHEASEALVDAAVRAHPPKVAAPRDVTTFNEIRSSDALLLWLGSAYPDIDVGSTAWREATLAFMKTRDCKVPAQDEIVLVIKRALSPAAQ